MGKYRPHAVGEYRLGTLGADAVAVWIEQGRRRRFRLGTALSQAEAEAELRSFARTRSQMVARGTITCQAVYERYIADKKLDGKPTREGLFASVATPSD